MSTLAFDAYDYCADDTFRLARYRIDGDERSGWCVERDGERLLELGPGYRALRVRRCGICSTDLARRFLPFELPQVIGHEVLAVDDAGRRFVVEINASHAARGVAHECAFCRSGLATHCPERVTLGIDRLPGGFGPWILAPVQACLPVPDAVDDDSAVLIEPLAAALHAATTVAPGAGERVAVLGPRRLGMLVVGAFAALRERRPERERFSVHAVLRSDRLADLARQLGADDVHRVDEAGLDEAFDVVVDTTGNPDALVDAVRLARREVHLKSTHGQPACGLEHLTELVVDELSVASLAASPPADGARVAWLDSRHLPTDELRQRCDVAAGSPEELAQRFAAARDGLPRADVAVVGDAAELARAIRPVAGSERALLRPRGQVLVHPDADVAGSPLLAAVVARGLVLSSSRCGDFAVALDLLARTEALRGLGGRFVSHTFDARELPRAFEVAGTRDCIKAVVTHPRG